MKWWFAQNTVCFAEPDALARMPALARTQCTAPLPLVHPGCLQSCTEALEAEQAPARKGGLWRRRTG